MRNFTVMSPDLLLEIAKPEIQEYIFHHENDDEKRLVLSNKEILGCPASLIASQIQGRRKAKHKLPLWYNTKGIIYPPSLNLEQSSSEATARFKSSLVANGKVAADLTGGFGVDSYFLSPGFENFYYVEPDEHLLAITQHNHVLLGVTNIQYTNTTAEEFLLQTNKTFDLIFIDPSRRNKQQKVFKLADCSPDVEKLLTSLSKNSKFSLIKTSPLLDIQQGLRELKNVEQVFVSSVNNEVKELLFLINKEFNISPLITAVDMNVRGEVNLSFSIHSEQEKYETVSFSPPINWLYEPNASLLKAGAFKTIASRHRVYKLHPSTHLYTSENKVEEFPGRTFKILQNSRLDKKINEYFPNGQANIITRNYPLSIEEIKKKTGLMEGGALFLICTQSEKSKHVLVAERIN